MSKERKRISKAKLSKYYLRSKKQTTKSHNQPKTEPKAPAVPKPKQAKVLSDPFQQRKPNKVTKRR